MVAMWIAMVALLCLSFSNVYSEEIDLKPVEDNSTRIDYNIETLQSESTISAEKTRDATAQPPSPTGAAATVPSKKCKTCREEELERKWHLEMIKEKIVKKLGVKQLQLQYNRDELAKIPPLAQLFHEYDHRHGHQHDHTHEGDDEEDVTTKGILVFAKRTPFSTLLSSKHLYFKFSPKIRHNEVVNANLWIYVQQRKVMQHTTTKLNIYQLKSPDGSRDKSELIASEKVEVGSSEGKWHSFNLTNVVQDWFADHKNNWGIEVEGVDHNGNSVAVVVTSPFDERNPKRPFVEIKTDQGHLHRVGRSVNNCPETQHSESQLCCRHRLRVNFTELGLPFVLQPREYDAYYCTGTCNFVAQSKSHISRASFISASQIDRCCSPTKMQKMSILYYNNDQEVIYGEIPNMIVKDCSCM